MNRADLVGYVRKSATGNSLKLTINKEALMECETYESKDGQNWIGLLVSLEKVKGIIDDEKEVTSICQIVDLD